MFWRCVEDKKPASSFGRWGSLGIHSAETCISGIYWTSLAGSASLTFSKIFPVSISIAGWISCAWHAYMLLRHPNVSRSTLNRGSCCGIWCKGPVVNLPAKSRGSPSDFTDCFSSDENGWRQAGQPCKTTDASWCFTMHGTFWHSGSVLLLRKIACLRIIF